MQKIYEFPSGMKLVYAGNDAVRSVAIGVFVNAGVAYERPLEAGVSHFIEHTVFKGTTTRSNFDIVNEAEKIGAQLNAYTAKTHTLFHSTSLDENAEECVDILSDMVLNPAFNADDLEKEKQVVSEEINESEDTPDDVCLENLSSAFYKGHPLEKPILGTKKTLKTFDSVLLRDYMRRQYVPKNTVISVAGNLPFDRCLQLVDKYFACQMKDNADCVRAEITEAKHVGKGVVKKKNISQAHVAVTFPSLPFAHPDSSSVNVLAEVFCAEMSSRLFQSIREKLGLCYSVYGYPSAYENNGSFTLYTATSPESTEKAVRAIRTEIERLLEDGITDEELMKGKQQLKTSLVLGQESSAGMMKAFGRYAVQTGKLYDISAKLEQINVVSKESVLSVARRIFDFDKACTSLVAKDVSADIYSIISGSKNGQ